MFLKIICYLFKGSLGTELNGEVNIQAAEITRLSITEKD